MNPLWNSSQASPLRTKYIVQKLWGGRRRRRCPHTVCRGVAQVFRDLLVELRLLLVAEVEEGEEGDRQEEGEEVKGGSQVEEITTTWMAMVME